MPHFIQNLSDGSRERAAAWLEAKAWALERGERHGPTLARGDLVLTHVGSPRCEFVGRAVLATALCDWMPVESAAFPAARSHGVFPTDVVLWPRAVPLEVVVRRIDPTASNPQVQANAGGFRSGIVLITAGEYEAVAALGREARRAWGPGSERASTDGDHEDRGAKHEVGRDEAADRIQRRRGSRSVARAERSLQLDERPQPDPAEDRDHQ